MIYMTLKRNIILSCMLLFVSSLSFAGTEMKCVVLKAENGSSSAETVSTLLTHAKESSDHYVNKSTGDCVTVLTYAYNDSYSADIFASPKKCIPFGVEATPNYEAVSSFMHTTFNFPKANSKDQSTEFSFDNRTFYRINCELVEAPSSVQK